MSQRIGKIEQLDSLRTIAAFLVIFHHFLPEFGICRFELGKTGVDVFFVISGFLITSILLEQKEAISSKLSIIKNFIIKRALRLFPIYYLLITFFLLLMVFRGLYAWDKGDGIYYFTYTQNILFFREGMKGLQLNHVWSLAVEEQFYLLWPWFVIFIPNRQLIRGLIAIILLTLIFKLFEANERYRLLTFYQLDTLGAGALMALFIKEKKDAVLLLLNKYKLTITFLSLSIMIPAWMELIPYAFKTASTFCFSAILVIGSYYRFENIPGRILDNRQMKYLGAISYGLYLYHKPVSYFMNLGLSKLSWSVNPFVLLAIALLLTVAISQLSYLLIERRFLKLKKKFDL